MQTADADGAGAAPARRRGLPAALVLAGAVLAGGLTVTVLVGVRSAGQPGGTDTADRALVVALGACALLLAVLVLELALGRRRAELRVERAVAELRRAEAAARRDAALLRAVLESISDGVGVVDAEGRFLVHNRAARDLLGGRADSDDPSSWQQHYDMWRPGGREPFPLAEMPLVRALAGESTDDVDVLVRAPDGTERLLSVSGRPLDATAGQAGAVAVFRDVSVERARTAQLASTLADLARSERRWRASFDSSLVGRVHRSPDGGLLRANDVALQLYGYDRQELAGLTAEQLLHPDDAPLVVEGMRRALSGVSGGFRARLRLRRREGGFRTVDSSAALIRDEDGNPEYFATQLVDVEEAVAAERELREQRDLYSQLLEALSDLGEAVTLTRDGVIEYANDAMCRLTGRSLEELRRLARSVDLLVPEDREVWLAERVTAPAHVPRQTRLLAADGTVVPVEAVSIALPSAGGRLRVAVCRDLSERVRAADELAASVARLEASNAELSAANQFKDDVVAMLSHDLRQPLTSAIGFCELVVDEWDGLPDEARRDLVARAARSGHWVNDLLEDVLTMARLDRGELGRDARAVDLEVAVEDAVVRLGASGAEVDSSGVPDVAVRVDPAQLQQVLANLLGNALKYGAAPVTVTARHHGTTVAVDVIDSGPGVPPAFEPHLFERFTRASGSARDQKGTGLGLWIARTLAEANGGSLAYRRASGRGARFTLTLPAVDRRGSGPALPERPPRTEVEPGRTGAPQQG
ncbi:PAS domain S-box-containing protein [Motilibacter rhizosphaerae]|uniref:Sensor-like histidine kinase SenX3 n=1 Tax=Motilibacter rhizosphaerae TaxID=598652 RepID=A0A4Q7NW86_9ACTN|nr:PAS domain-containing sensor histidine kinase [Motilibacter rhizosphaerae]RZS91270.1 PAS domain S-box-containing protein [Motilibacter rhizosphaerae]